MMLKLTADVLVGVCVAMLAGMGVGGGGLLVIYLTAVAGMDQLDAQGVNLVFFIFASASALIRHLPCRKLVINDITAAAMTGCAASAVSGALAPLAGNGIVRICFGVLLILSGVMVLFGSPRKK